LVSLLVHYHIMLRLNISDAKRHLSRYLERVERGETILLCRRNLPIAEIRPLARDATTLRPIGTAPDLRVPPEFFEPLPEDVLSAFEGGDSEEDTEST